MIQINLIPQIKKEYLKARSLRNLVISTSIMAGLVLVGAVAILGVVFAGYVVASDFQDGEIKKRVKELTSIEDLDKVVTIQHQLESINSQHKEKSTNSRLFDVMSAIVPPAPNDISISTLRFDPKEELIYIEGSASNGYEALEVFKKTIKHTMVQVVNGKDSERVPLATNISSGETSFGESADGQKVLRFSISFNYPSELFTSSGGSVHIESPSGKVDVTDSLVGVPESLFKSSTGISGEDDEDGR